MRKAIWDGRAKQPKTSAAHLESIATQQAVADAYRDQKTKPRFIWMSEELMKDMGIKIDHQRWLSKPFRSKL